MPLLGPLVGFDPDNTADRSMVLSKLPNGREFVGKFGLPYTCNILLEFCAGQLTAHLRPTFEVAYWQIQEESEEVSLLLYVPN